MPDTNFAAQRLLKNQVDIGNAIKPFYGNVAGDKLTSLLKDHIMGAVDLLKAAKAGNTTGGQLLRRSGMKMQTKLLPFLAVPILTGQR